MNSISGVSSYQPNNIGSGSFYHKDGIYGAEYRSYQPKEPKHWERIYKHHIEVPWLGQCAEKTFLNRTTIPNKPKLHKHLFLTAPDAETNMKFTSPLIEGFRSYDVGQISLVLLLVFAFFLVFDNITKYNF
ncbi:MAG: hypothetical protein CMF62_03500 [Magnetococcales bacterium]|nr:hypothetical protein [Magnetococcales bacterium]|tara:strand:+ start:53184 stop:53576 length:393 start_codon:yes stop_codon:yes gene_type:complete